MNYRNEMSRAYQNNDVKAMVTLYDDLNTKMKYLNKWFDLYTEKFSNRMDKEDPNSPVWSTYRTKYKEYSEINAVYGTAKYYLKKMGVGNV